MVKKPDLKVVPMGPLPSTRTKPKSILDPSFRYTNSASTDLRKTFARIRREMKKEE